MSAFRNYDAWATREPPEPAEPPVCEECGEDLPEQAYKMVETTTSEWCDGRPAKSEYRYDDGSHEGVLAIIGEEFRSQTYTVAHSPICGHKTPEKWGGYQEEISEGAMADWEHEPHWYVSPMNSTTTYFYRCSNGHENTHVDV